MQDFMVMNISCKFEKHSCNRYIYIFFATAVKGDVGGVGGSVTKGNP